MSIDICRFRIDQHRRENEIYESSMFPLSAYYNDMDCYPEKTIPWHFHEEVETIYVEKGSIEVYIQDEVVKLNSTEGIFINTNQLHRILKGSQNECVFYSFVFAPILISGGIHSVFEQRYVKPLLQCQQLSHVAFTSKQWHKTAANCIFEAFVNYERERYAYEFLVREKLSYMWMLIMQNCQAIIKNKNKEESTETKRMKQMLEYIHNHYNQILRVEDIAQCANISKRECLRCFQKMLNDSPIQYILKYRIAQAAGLLEEGRLSITDICTTCGFDDPSYFSRTFHRYMHMTPRDYRLKYRQNNTESWKY